MATVLNICKQIRKENRIINEKYNQAVYAKHAMSGAIELYKGSKLKDVSRRIHGVLGKIETAQQMLEKDSRKHKDYKLMQQELSMKQYKIQELGL